jgi:hypothetical protein
MGRKHERAEVVKEVLLESATGQRTSRISDMSMGGCYIESINNFRKGEYIAFDVSNTAGSNIRFGGNVAYVLDGFGFGLTFTNLTPAHLTFLNESLPKAPAPIAESDANILELW